MPKIRKRTSKRVGFREKYAVQKKVLEHHRKLRKTAKKLSKLGLRPKPGKKGDKIPNLYPGKEELLNEMAQRDATEREEYKKRKTVAEADAVAHKSENLAYEQSLKANV